MICDKCGSNNVTFYGVTDNGADKYQCGDCFYQFVFKVKFNNGTHSDHIIKKIFEDLYQKNVDFVTPPKKFDPNMPTGYVFKCGCVSDNYTKRESDNIAICPIHRERLLKYRVKCEDCGVIFDVSIQSGKKKRFCCECAALRRNENRNRHRRKIKILNN